MDLKKGYLRISRRSLVAATETLRANIQEAIGFYSYHAFESLGGAVCHHHGRSYSNQSHRKKINQFVAASNSYRFGLTVAYLAIVLSSVRNECLYPQEGPDGSVILPEHAIPITHAKRLLSGVRGIYRSIAAVI